MQVPERGSYESFNCVVVGLENEFRVLDAQGKTLFSRPYLHDPHVWTSVQVAENSAGDRLYVPNRNADVFVLRASPKFECLATNSIGGEVMNASLAVSDGDIFMRTHSQLWCIREAGKR